MVINEKGFTFVFCIFKNSTRLGFVNVFATINFHMYIFSMLKRIYAACNSCNTGTRELLVRYVYLKPDYCYYDKALLLIAQGWFAVIEFLDVAGSGTRVSCEAIRML